MMILAIVLGSVLAYLLIGAFYARSQAVEAHQRAEKTWYTDRSKQESFLAQLWWRVFFWPWAVVLDNVIRGAVTAWFTRPVAERKAKAALLRDDATRWRNLRHTGSPQEREMAATLAQMCEERAREVDL